MNELDFRFDFEGLQSAVNIFLLESRSLQDCQNTTIYITGLRVDDCESIVAWIDGTKNVLERFVVPPSDIKQLLNELERIQVKMREMQSKHTFVKLTVKFSKQESPNHYNIYSRLLVAPYVEDQFNDISSALSALTIPSTIRTPTHDTPLGTVGIETMTSGNDQDSLSQPLLQQLNSSMPHQQTYHLGHQRPQLSIQKLLIMLVGVFMLFFATQLSEEPSSQPPSAPSSQPSEEPSSQPSSQPSPNRVAKVLDCARKLSKGQGLSDNGEKNTAQWNAVKWLATGPGRNIDITQPCRWGSAFGKLYALIVTRESLGVSDVSWHGAQPLRTFDEICRWKRITCDEDDQTVKRLTLNHAGLNGTIPIELVGLENLSDLQMENNYVFGTIPFELGELTNLEYIFLHKTSISGKIQTSLGRLSTLQQLLLDRTRLTGSVPSEVCLLRNMSLYSLRADCKGVYPESPAVGCDNPSCCTSCFYRE